VEEEYQYRPQAAVAEDPHPRLVAVEVAPPHHPQEEVAASQRL
jgi:hypothetical protein